MAHPPGEFVPTAIGIEDFTPSLAPAFRALNLEWLERYFSVEPVDRQVLDDPQHTIIDHGGHILFAVLDGLAVGTVALKHHGDGVFELTKMAVTDALQGRGVGRRLLRAAVDRFAAAGGRTLFLESHSSLQPALHLYVAEGFRHVQRPTPSGYRRSDVYMEYSAAENAASSS